MVRVIHECAFRAVMAAGLMVACGGAAGPPASATATAQFLEGDVAGDIRTTIRAIAADGQPGPAALSSSERAQLAVLYARGEHAPLWVGASGRPSADAREALAVLTGAADDGLVPDDYGAATLGKMANELEASHSPAAREIAAFDVALSVNMLRYLRQLHLGRVDPRAIGFKMTAPANDHDFASLLGVALAGHRITASAAELAPPLGLYRDLRRALARYRSLVAGPAFGPLPPSGASVHPGERYAGLGELHRRLVAFGDLPPEVPVPGEGSAYDGAVVEGVKRFQTRHGLQPDGVLGQSTQAALRVSPDQRVRQIELALERLRWLPDLTQERLVAVNIPMFRLWAWDAIPPEAGPSVTTGVIVGRALNTRTPVFDEEMRYIIFRPYWNIPPSILRHETLPALERDPRYFERQDLEIVSGQGDNATPVALTKDSIAGLRQGRLRVRQRPGPKNSLGLIKFVFPNDENVYLHATPAQQLFSRPRRDFSHGCVRVEDPVALAEWALKDQPEWTRERIVAAMNGRDSRRVNLTRPIEVTLFYITAAVMPEDGTIRFAEDIYRHDARLEQALARGRLLTP